MMMSCAGVLRSDFLVQFLERVLHPVTRIASNADLVNFVTLADVSFLVVEYYCWGGCWDYCSVASYV